ncbi:MAG TPA: hypothetical protein VGY53_05855, partial [Isosphaeraceae bacterium]|nr:hypothetical protein [Isosphaeraceae bacterium]
SRGAGRLRPLIAIAGATILSLALVSPFIIASLGVAKNGAPHAVGSLERLDGIKKLVVRLVTDPEFSVSRSLSTSAAMAAAALSVLASGLVPRSRRCVAAVALSLGIGLGAVTAAQLVVTHFPAANYNYNIWMRPAVCILLSAGLAAQCLSARRVAVLASVFVLAVEACGTYQLAAHGDSFAHGPHRAIVELIRGKNVQDVAVVHDDPLYRIMLVYHSIRYELGPDLAQYQLVAAPGGAPLVRDHPSGRGLQPVTALPYRYLVVVRLRMGNAMQPARATGVDRALEYGRLAGALCESADWRLVSERIVHAHFSAQIDLFESCRPPCQNHSVHGASQPAREAQTVFK